MFDAQFDLAALVYHDHDDPDNSNLKGRIVVR